MSIDRLIAKFADKQVAEKYAKAAGEAKKTTQNNMFCRFCRMESGRY